MWYVSQFQPGQHTTAPDARTSFSTVNSQLLTAFAIAVGQDFDARLAAADSKAQLSHSHCKQTKQYQQNPQVEKKRLAMEFEVAGGFNGPKTAAYTRQLLHQLIKTWSAPGAKVVCLCRTTTPQTCLRLRCQQPTRQCRSSGFPVPKTKPV